MAHHTSQPLHAGEIQKPNTGWIWKTFWIITGITALEFVIAFLMPSSTARNSIFIILTIFKAFFIVANFMHLKDETKGLIWTIMIPMSLLIWLLVALITEGNAIHNAIF
ncbi:cytochrome C oxidase subunit IV family protein [Hymenobacter sp. NST-14]|uniref:cytochrome C oxidase subunit IV family protein n=1 Tax=Hymenobacter piscis TaxID=2839984 RepID=UPI001C035009|nr:cytochrome C oxidase subunit IV family protein [Hymenobacter piscis]MBT9391602.1 cytochrome C oxidase subunit IV family protein [Hymenobacter piscis]